MTVGTKRGNLMKHFLISPSIMLCMRQFESGALHIYIVLRLHIETSDTAAILTVSEGSCPVFSV